MNSHGILSILTTPIFTCNLYTIEYNFFKLTKKVVWILKQIKMWDCDILNKLISFNRRLWYSL